MSFSHFRQEREKGLSARTIQELTDEINKRDRHENIFPLDVFNDKIKPFIEVLNQHYDIPRSFIGLLLLSCYSSAIGTSYCVSTNGQDKFYLPVWSCLLGMSSSGKTLGISKIYKPLFDVQAEFDTEWRLKKRDLKKFELVFERKKTIVYRDAHVPTLIRYVLPDNPKGVAKWSDELIEWINGMNQLSNKEGTDEQFWISTWNCTSYSAIRSGKDSIELDRPFVNVFGGIQWSLLHKLFAKDRDSTGFIFRLLFASPDQDKIAEPDPLYEVPENLNKLHFESIRRMYCDLEVEMAEHQPKMCLLTPDAIKHYSAWVREKIIFINAIEDIADRDIAAGILGKIKEYVLRFAAILTLADISYTDQFKYDKFFSWQDQVPVMKETMLKALRLGDYFYQSAKDTHDRVKHQVTAPQEVLMIAALIKMGKSLTEMCGIMWQSDTPTDKKRMERKVKKYIREYPRVFNALAR